MNETYLPINPAEQQIPAYEAMEQVEFRQAPENMTEEVLDLNPTYVADIQEFDVNDTEHLVQDPEAHWVQYIQEAGHLVDQKRAYLEYSPVNVEAVTPAKSDGFIFQFVKWFVTKKS